jgi:hypothetical protein
MHSACAIASASIASSTDIVHSIASIRLVMVLAKVGPLGNLFGERLRLRQHLLRRNDTAEEPPALALLRGHEAAGIEQLRSPRLPDDARQDRTRPHVAAGKTDLVEQERDLGASGRQTHVRRHCDDRACAGANPLNRRDDRLRTGPHRLAKVAGHAGEGSEAFGVHLHQRADDLEHIAA